eukprot:s1157_g3.t1
MAFGEPPFAIGTPIRWVACCHAAQWRSPPNRQPSLPQVRLRSHAGRRSAPGTSWASDPVKDSKSSPGSPTASKKRASISGKAVGWFSEFSVVSLLWWICLI